MVSAAATGTLVAWIGGENCTQIVVADAAKPRKPCEVIPGRNLLAAVGWSSDGSVLSLDASCTINRAHSQGVCASGRAWYRRSFRLDRATSAGMGSTLPFVVKTSASRSSIRGRGSSFSERRRSTLRSLPRNAVAYVGELWDSKVTVRSIGRAGAELTLPTRGFTEAIAYSHDGASVFTAGQGQQGVNRWSCSDGRRLNTYVVPSDVGAVVSLFLSDDGRWMIGLTWGGKLVAWDLSRIGAPARVLEGFEGNLSGGSWLPGSATFVSCTDAAGPLVVWNMKRRTDYYNAAGLWVHSFEGMFGQAENLVYSPSKTPRRAVRGHERIHLGGRKGGSPRCVTRWKWGSGTRSRPPATLTHWRGVRTVGSWLAAADGSSTVVWDAQSKEQTAVARHRHLR